MERRERLHPGARPALGKDRDRPLDDRSRGVEALHAQYRSDPVRPWRRQPGDTRPIRGNGDQGSDPSISRFGRARRRPLQRDRKPRGTQPVRCTRPLLPGGRLTGSRRGVRAAGAHLLPGFYPAPGPTVPGTRSARNARSVTRRSKVPDTATPFEYQSRPTAQCADRERVEWGIEPRAFWALITPLAEPHKVCASSSRRRRIISASASSRRRRR